MAYANNRFCWHGCISTDTDKAKAFYSEVMGWSLLEQQMGDETATMFVNAGIPRAHLMAPPMDGVPSHWNNYLRVDDIDAATAACAANGGQVLVPVTQIPPGHFSVVQSPSGAALSLFHEADEASAQNAPDDVGGVTWTELWSKDIDKDLAWLQASLGITSETMPMPTGDYHLLQWNGESIKAGAMQAQSDESPACWMVWFKVEDVNDTLGRAGNNGGNVIMPAQDVPGVGTLAVIADPTGGVFGVIKPAEQG